MQRSEYFYFSRKILILFLFLRNFCDFL